MSAVFGGNVLVWKDKAMKKMLDLSLLSKCGPIYPQIGWVLVDGSPVEVVITKQSIQASREIGEDGLKMFEMKEYREAKKRQKERNRLHFLANPDLLTEKIRKKRRSNRLLRVY